MFVKAAALFFALKSDHRGVASLEYAIMAALVAVVITGAVSSLGISLSATFNTIAASVQGAN